MLDTTRTCWIFFVALLLAAPTFGATEPTSEQIYEAARLGHLDQAEQMIDQVLRDHPKSARAHYVAAEVYAKEGRVSVARKELGSAENLAPGLPFAKSDSVAALQRELARGEARAPAAAYWQARSAVPWGMIVMVLGGVALLWLYFRRRNLPSPSSYPSAAPVGAGMPGSTGVITGAPNISPGIGSGIAGGLASGLAVGAGVVAGEEIARHFLDSGSNEGNVRPPSERGEYSGNSDLGGADFGLSDGSSWDDDSSSADTDLGGNDWT